MNERDKIERERLRGLIGGLLENEMEILGVKFYCEPPPELQGKEPIKIVQSRVDYSSLHKFKYKLRTRENRVEMPAIASRDFVELCHIVQSGLAMDDLELRWSGHLIVYLLISLAEKASSSESRAKYLVANPDSLIATEFRSSCRIFNKSKSYFLKAQAYA